MSVLFYLLVAFVVLDINVINGARDWLSIDRAFVGFLFFMFVVADGFIVKELIERLRNK